MDGAKPITDTIDNLRMWGRQASCMGESVLGRVHEPCRNENPGGSRIRAE